MPPRKRKENLVRPDNDKRPRSKGGFVVGDIITCNEANRYNYTGGNWIGEVTDVSEGYNYIAVFTLAPRSDRLVGEADRVGTRYTVDDSFFKIADE